MDFFKEFSKQFSNVARSVSGTPKEGAEVARLNAELKAVEGALEKLYARYGKACYAYNHGAGDARAVEALAVQVQAALLRLDEVTEQRDAARQFKRCMSCGAVHPLQARFCSACGKRLPDEAPKPEPAAAGEYCPGCGALREGGEARCPVCGAYFDAQPQPAEPAPAAPAMTQTGPDIEEPDDTIE